MSFIRKMFYCCEVLIPVPEKTTKCSPKTRWKYSNWNTSSSIAVINLNPFLVCWQKLQKSYLYSYFNEVKPMNCRRLNLFFFFNFSEKRENALIYLNTNSSKFFWRFAVAKIILWIFDFYIGFKSRYLNREMGKAEMSK